MSVFSVCARCGHEEGWHEGYGRCGYPLLCAARVYPCRCTRFRALRLAFAARVAVITVVVVVLAALEGGVS